MAKFISILSLAVASVNAHAIFHSAVVNGKSQGLLFGVRAPESNNPIQDVSSSSMACNSGLKSPVSKDVIELAPGDKFGMQWNHVIGGPQGSGDQDDPIAASHKGPVMVYMAKVDDASSADGSGLKWFKTAEEGLNTATGQWGVDTLIANKGLWDFTVPNLAAGDYLLRGEVLALHSAGSSGEAQFYVSCAAVRVSGSGTCAPSDTVSFPGAYKSTDAGILISIYGGDGKPNNGGKAYTPPGPRPITCSGSGSGSSSGSKSSTTAAVKTTGSLTVSQSATTKDDMVSTTAIIKTTGSLIASQSVTTKNNVVSTTATGTSASGSGNTSNSVLPSTALPTTFQTSTRAATSKAGTTSRVVSPTSAEVPEWGYWNAPTSVETSKSVLPSTRTTKFTLSASGIGSTTKAAVTSAASITSVAAPSSIVITATNDTNIKVPTSTGGTSPQPTVSGLPGGKKYVCYEVTDE